MTKIYRRFIQGNNDIGQNNYQGPLIVKLDKILAMFLNFGPEMLYLCYFGWIYDLHRAKIEHFFKTLEH